MIKKLALALSLVGTLAVAPVYAAPEAVTTTGKTVQHVNDNLKGNVKVVHYYRHHRHGCFHRCLWRGHSRYHCHRLCHYRRW